MPGAHALVRSANLQHTRGEEGGDKKNKKKTHQTGALREHMTASEEVRQKGKLEEDSRGESERGGEIY